MVSAITPPVAPMLFHRLQKCFPEPHYITLEEVRDATGFDGVRTADAMVISLYRSRGKMLWGFEFKVSRADWLKELKQPEKSESIMRYCHRWALVVSDPDIVKPGELPSTWGMYVPRGDKLKCVVPCPTLEPVPMGMTMFTAIAYAITQRQAKSDVAALNEATQRGIEIGEKRADHNHRSYELLREKIEVFEKASGLSIEHAWRGPKDTGVAVSRLLSGNKDLKQLTSSMRYATKQLESGVKALKEQGKVFEDAIRLCDPGLVIEIDD